jgi:hypothetical protein
MIGPDLLRKRTLLPAGPSDQHSGDELGDEHQAAQPTVLGPRPSAPAGSWVTNRVTIALNTYGLRRTSEHKSTLMKTASRTGYRYTDIALQRGGAGSNTESWCSSKDSNRIAQHPPHPAAIGLRLTSMTLIDRYAPRW